MDMTDQVQVPGSRPHAPAISVYTDGVTVTGNGTSADPLVSTGDSATFELRFDAQSAGNRPIGSPLSASLTGNNCVTSQADDTPGAFCVGLATEAAVDGELVNIRPSGILTLTTVQWDVILGNVSPAGLNPGAAYYLSADHIGRLTEVVPSAGGTYANQIGIAASSTRMLIQISGAVFNT